MTSLIVTSTELGKVGRYLDRKRFLMYPRRGHHIRLDLKAFGNGQLSAPVADGVVRYQISSFHVKRDLEHDTFIGTTPGPREGKRIVEDKTDYVYFKYVDEGVWQPLWGYYKEEQSTQGKMFWKETGEMSADTWGFACTAARNFLEQLSKALGPNKGQALAMGPVQGASAK